MKTKYTFLGAFVAVVIGFGTLEANAQYSDNFNGSLDPGWVTDRYAPNSVDTAGGTLNLNISSADDTANRPPQFSDSFYNYQGVTHAVTGVSGDWTATEQINITQAMLSQNSSAGFWVRTANGGDESTADYNILQFRNNGTDAAGLYAWNDVTGTWISTAASISPGLHTLTMDYNGSDVLSYIDGSLVYDNSALGDPTYAGDVTSVFDEAYNYGANYTASFDNLDVSVGTVPDAASTGGLLTVGASFLALLARKFKKA